MANPPSSTHRVDTQQRLLHRFYEPLVLLWILSPSQRAAELDLTFEARSQHFHVFWRRFLDGLCFLCDPEKGGSAVCALTAEIAPDGPAFWFASAKDKARSQLEGILQDLASRNRQPSRIADHEVEERIVVNSIMFSKGKVDTYGRFLRTAIARAIGSTTADHKVSPHLIEQLEVLEQNRKYHLALAEAASNFGGHQDLSELMQKTARVQERSPWADVNHHIGRLGAWRRIARTLVGFARHFPQIIQNYTVRFLRIPGPILAPVADRKTNLQSALKRMLPSKDADHAKLLNEALEELRIFNIPEAFQQQYSNPVFMPHVHAEVYLLEHFYFGPWQFCGERSIRRL